MCGFDWASLREWLGTLGEVTTGIVALFALLAWRSHLRGETRFRVTHKVLEEAHLLRYFFYDARNGLIDPSEYPPGYQTTARPTSSEKADGLAYVFKRRYRMVRREILALHRLRARAAAALGDDTERRIEELIRKASQLYGLMVHRVGQVRDGNEQVSQRPDQAWEQRVSSGAQMQDPRNHDDPFSQEFEEKLKALEEALAKYK